MKAKEFTKNVSPTKWGLREQLQDSGQLKFVHEWMNRYAKELAEHAFKAGRISVNITFEQWYETFGALAEKSN
jgi:hypothetical protein